MIFKRDALLSVGLAVLFALPACCWSQPLPWQDASAPLHQSRQEKEADQLGAADREKLEKDMKKKANQQRQQELKRDTDKLLELATELKQYVDKTNENMLSVDVINKAEQIEKLAHSVREKMKAY